MEAAFVFALPPPVSFEEKRLQPVSRLFGLTGEPADRYYRKFCRSIPPASRKDVLEVMTMAARVKFGYECSTSCTSIPRRASLRSRETSRPETLRGNLIASSARRRSIYLRSGNWRYRERTGFYGGVLLATVSGISQISRYDMDR